jgi:hypothetical protein
MEISSSLKSLSSTLLCAALSVHVVGCGSAPQQDETSSGSDALVSRADLADAVDSRTSVVSARTGARRPVPPIKIPLRRAVVPKPIRGAFGSAVPADYDGDGRFDVAEKKDDGSWSIDFAANGFGAWDAMYLGFGPAYFRPLPGDYDGDGKADLATRDDDGTWYIDFADVKGFGAWDKIVYGEGVGDGDPVPADYDGDGVVDLSVKDHLGYWHIDYAANGFGAWDVSFPEYGDASSVPVPADYDGDGRADLAVKNADGDWYIDFAANGFGNCDVLYQGFGGPEFAPVPADYDGDGRADLATRDSWDDWYLDFAANGFGNWDQIHAGFAASAAYQPVPADYDGDGKTDLASHTDDDNWFIDYASDGFGAWNQDWSSLVTVSAGPALTAEDLLKFDSTWLNQNGGGKAGGDLYEATLDLSAGKVPASWGTDEHMRAMARMYELTHDQKYFDNLRQYVQVALAHRDDKRYVGGSDSQEPEHPFDRVRQATGLPAWGGTSPVDGYYRENEDASWLYAYPIAAFARIVAENPMLQEAYGAEAIEDADAVMQTVDVFLPQVRKKTVYGRQEAFLVAHPNLANVASYQNCEDGRARMLATYAPDPPTQDQINYVNQLVSNCEGEHANDPFAFNENNLFLMVLIEMSRVIDSPYYQASASAANAQAARTLYPQLVAQGQRYFSDHLWLVHDTWIGGVLIKFPESPRYVWKHGEGGNDDDDASHSSASMRYISLLNRDLERLTSAAAVAGESMSFDASYLRRFANTFLFMTDAGDMAEDNSGKPGNPRDVRDYNCEGWIDLSVVDARVYDRCHEISLRQVNGTQLYVGKGNHSDLLANKHVRYPAWRAPISSSLLTSEAR